jgi:hypothetical protein
VVLSVVALAVILWAWALSRAGKQPAICDALLNVGLPWMLGWTLARYALQWSDTAPVLLPAVAVGVAFTALQWGTRRAYLSNGGRMFAAWLGQAAVLLALIGIEQSWVLVLAAALFLLPAMWLWRSRAMAMGVERALQQSGPWWLAAMLLSAVALR